MHPLWPDIFRGELREPPVIAALLLYIVGTSPNSAKRYSSIYCGGLIFVPAMVMRADARRQETDPL